MVTLSSNQSNVAEFRCVCCDYVCQSTALSTTAELVGEETTTCCCCPFHCFLVFILLVVAVVVVVVVVVDVRKERNVNKLCLVL